MFAPVSEARPITISSKDPAQFRFSQTAGLDELALAGVGLLAERLQVPLRLDLNFAEIFLLNIAVVQLLLSGPKRRSQLLVNVGQLRFPALLQCQQL